ncbi:MAG: YtxH domain-containing protein [Myxococcaceae bacterium]|nr:YtxH domain-containing protein [Myxococcaceae bacterium]
MDLKDIRKQLGNLEKDDILKIFGVEERRSMMDVLLPALGLFGAGLVVGAGIGLLLAPKPGRELVGELRSRIQGNNVSGQIGPAARVGEGAARTA